MKLTSAVFTATLQHEKDKTIREESEMEERCRP
jgi:hypothetical protein